MAWADRSPTEQAALEYCAPRGIPLSVFLAGRVVYPGDPQWLADDVRAVFDWQSAQADRCECGGEFSETMLEENAYAYKAVPLYCHRCRAIHRAAVRLAKGKEDPLAGTRYRVEKVEVPD